MNVKKSIIGVPMTDIAPDKNLRSLGKYAPFFGELGINIFNWVSQYITVLFHCVFQNFQLGIRVS